MTVNLLRAARINFNAGDIVEVSPEQARFLFSVGSAKPFEIREAKTEEEAKKPKKAKK